MPAYPERGHHEPTESEILLAMVAIEGDAVVATIGGHLDAWNRQDAIAVKLGDLAAAGLAVKGLGGGWRLSDRGERRARRSRGPFAT